MKQWRELAARGEFRQLKLLLAAEDMTPLRDSWSSLGTMEKAVLFKLMEPQAAMDFFATLPFDEKYLLFEAFDPGTIAPVTEDLSPRLRSLFHRLSEDCYEEMFRQLASSDPR